MTSLEVRGLSGRAAGGPRVRALSFHVDSGQIAAVFGRPDAGKRALLRLVCGLDRPEDGEVLVDGQNVAGVPPQRRRLGVVLRDAPMFPGTVRDNVVYGLKQHGWAKHDRERRVAAALELVGMTGTEGEPVASLNADERARIALARALAPEPVALLLEAPTAHVDEVLKPDYRARLREVLHAIPVTTVIFTDDLRDAVGMADDLHVLADGALLQSGPLSRVLAGPNASRVAEMVGYVTLIRGDVDGDWILEPGAGAIQFPAGFPLSGTARAMAHPSAMLGVPESSGLGSGVNGLIERVRATGPTYLLDLRVGDRLVEVRWEWDLAPPPSDEPIAIAVTPGTLRFFNDGPARARSDDHVSPPYLVDEYEPGDGGAEDEPEDALHDEDPAPEAEEPHDAASDEDEPAVPEMSWGLALSPAPSPPRTGAAVEDGGAGEWAEGGEREGSGADDGSVAALAPWLQVSRPVAGPGADAGPQDGEDLGELAEGHQGMPLD
ncbi:MAG: ATP-binding cassette domain-containing protein [Dehalococcoidia bacterium]|nr:ATP-binding cassette domain-containing protein [Dehalococcoidia bacterium]